MKKVYFLQRAFAYVIDTILVSIVGFIIGSFLIFHTESYDNAVSGLENLTKSYLNNEITEEKFLEDYKEYTYVVDKGAGLSTVVQLVIATLYFGSFAYYNNGMTLGKKLMKIKTVSNDDSELSHGKFIIRATIISGVFTECFSLLAVLLTSSSTYYIYNELFSVMYSIFIFASVLMILFRKDNRGIHDLIVGSKIISLKE